jgi:hypothetical protein
VSEFLARINFAVITRAAAEGTANHRRDKSPQNSHERAMNVPKNPRKTAQALFLIRNGRFLFFLETRWRLA